MNTQINSKSICKRTDRIFTFLFLSLLLVAGRASSAIPRPDHVLICILENHGYPQIIGSSAAPYINQLASLGANMQEFYALTHPSQPNYLMMFGGSNFGVTTDAVPASTPWSSANLGASLRSAGFSFSGYSEDLPSIGSNVASAGGYARKHNPWVNWQGTGTNQLPVSCNLSMNQFPTDFNLLPSLSFVIPNQDNDMHNGSDPARITTSDDWVRNHLMAYVNWAMSHNSLFILTFDEDNNAYQNRIPCIFVGPMVVHGDYTATGYNHYDFLRTLEDMYGLSYMGNSASAHSITEIWDPNATGIINLANISVSTSVSPNPVTASSMVTINNEMSSPVQNLHFALFDMLGNRIQDEVVELNPGRTTFPFRREGLRSGIYFFRLIANQKILSTGKVVIE